MICLSGIQRKIDDPWVSGHTSMLLTDRLYETPQSIKSQSSSKPKKKKQIADIKN